MDFLNPREGGMVFYKVFLLSPLQREFEEIYVNLKAKLYCRPTVNSK
jgi:hypothetical protein